MALLFATDDELAQRLRRVADELRAREPAAATELLEVARILDPDPEPSHSHVRESPSERLFAA